MDGHDIKQVKTYTYFLTAELQRAAVAPVTAPKNWYCRFEMVLLKRCFLRTICTEIQGKPMYGAGLCICQDIHLLRKYSTNFSKQFPICIPKAWVRREAGMVLAWSKVLGLKIISLYLKSKLNPLYRYLPLRLGKRRRGKMVVPSGPTTTSWISKS